MEPPAAERADTREKIHTALLIEACSGGLTEEAAEALDFEYGPEDDEEDLTEEEAAAIEARRMAAMVMANFT